MLHTGLKSTAIKAMEYSRKNRTLKIVFVSNPSVVYVYHNVSRWISDKLRFNDAPGRYFVNRIKNAYSFTKVVA